MVTINHSILRRYSVVFGTSDKVIDHMLEQKTDGDITEGTVSW